MIGIRYSFGFEAFLLLEKCLKNGLVLLSNPVHFKCSLLMVLPEVNQCIIILTYHHSLKFDLHTFPE